MQLDCDLQKVRVDRIIKFSEGEISLARRVILETFFEIKELRKAHLVKWSFKCSKNKNYQEAKRDKQIQDIHKWFLSDSCEEGSYLFWANICTDDPISLRRNMLAMCGLKGSLGKEIKLPKKTRIRRSLEN